MTMLPAKPACFGQHGRIQCAKGCNHDCRANRQFWVACDTAEKFSTDRDRRDWLGLIARSK